MYKVRSKSNTGSQGMDQATGNESISELFAHEYNTLYNSVCYNTTQLNNLMKMNDSDIMTKCSTSGSPLINKHLHSVSVNPLQYAINYKILLL